MGQKMKTDSLNGQMVGKGHDYWSRGNYFVQNAHWENTQYQLLYYAVVNLKAFKVVIKV